MVAAPTLTCPSPPPPLPAYIRDPTIVGRGKGGWVGVTGRRDYHGLGKQSSHAPVHGRNVSRLLDGNNRRGAHGRSARPNGVEPAAKRDKHADPHHPFVGLTGLGGRRLVLLRQHDAVGGGAGGADSASSAGGAGASADADQGAAAGNKTAATRKAGCRASRCDGGGVELDGSVGGQLDRGLVVRSGSVGWRSAHQ